MIKFILGLLMYVMLIIPPIRIYLESIMVVHMLIQLPLLIISGWLIGSFIVEKLKHTFDQWDSHGVAGIVLIIFITTYWMIPRALDEALISQTHEILKFISLPLVGFLIADSWKKIKALGKSFVFLNYLSMFVLMGWLYIDSPIQICNNYLVAEQQTLGWGFISLAIAMIVYFLHYVFTDHSTVEE
ncbi:hypothetical protein ACLIA0_08870 [Bacillaceae bacterium W0354]